MKCADARKALAGAVGEDCPLEVAEHLAGCLACRAEHERSQVLDRLVATATWSEPPEAVVQGAVRRGMARAARGPATSPAVGRLAWVGAALAAFLLGFGARGLAPRQETATQAPEVREKIVRVEVPVERVVERIVRVPVVQRRVVIRYLPRQVGGATGGKTVQLYVADNRPVQPKVIVEKLPDPQMLPQIQYTESVRLARLAEAEPER